MADTQPAPLSSPARTAARERYVRTFARDMEALKAGKKPDLTPLDTPNVTADANPVPAKTPPPAPVPVLPDIPAAPTNWNAAIERQQPHAPVSLADAISGSVAQLRGARAQSGDSFVLPPLSAPVSMQAPKMPQAPQPVSPLTPAPPVVVPPPAPVTPPAPAVPPAAAEPMPVQPRAPGPAGEPSRLHTYSGDFSDHVRDRHASPAAILAAEQDSHTGPVRPEPARPQKKPHTVVYAVGAVVLIGLGIYGVYYATALLSARTAPVPVVQTVSFPIFVDERATVSGSGAPLMQSLMQASTRSLADGSVLGLSLASGSASQNVFLSLQLPAPGILLRNITDTGSMAGVVAAGGSTAPFFILGASSYGDTFAGMLQWEKTMPQDLAAFYPPLGTPHGSVATTSASSTPSTAQATSTPLAQGTAAFKDVVVSNHDARAYVDAYGRTVMLYGYWNQNTLVIARDQAAFSEVLSRLSNSPSQ